MSLRSELQPWLATGGCGLVHLLRTSVPTLAKQRGEIYNIPHYLMQTQRKVSRIALQGVLLLDGRPAVRVHKGSLTP